MPRRSTVANQLRDRPTPSCDGAHDEAARPDHHVALLHGGQRRRRLHLDAAAVFHPPHGLLGFGRPGAWTEQDRCARSSRASGRRESRPACRARCRHRSSRTPSRRRAAGPRSRADRRRRTATRRRSSAYCRRAFPAAPSPERRHAWRRSRCADTAAASAALPAPTTITSYVCPCRSVIKVDPSFWYVSGNSATVANASARSFHTIVYNEMQACVGRVSWRTLEFRIGGPRHQAAGVRPDT